MWIVIATDGSADRRKEILPERDVDVWTGYDFAGRAGRYSTMKYKWYHFSGTDWEAKLQNNDHLYRFVGPGKPGWAKDVDDSQGNADYL
jgi:alpha-amylase